VPLKFPSISHSRDRRRTAERIARRRTTKKPTPAMLPTTTGSSGPQYPLLAGQRKRDKRISEKNDQIVAQSKHSRTKRKRSTGEFLNLLFHSELLSLSFAPALTFSV
jgi:hypothetical protein